MAVINTSGGNRPTLRPSLLLDFGNSKALDPHITFTRSSVGTYWDGSSSALVEHNFINNTADPSTYERVATNITYNAATAPDGGADAAKFTPTAATSIHGILPGNNSYQVVNGFTYTFSAYVKNAGYDDVYIGENSYGVFQAHFVISTNTVSSTGGTTSNATIRDIGDGWRRITVTFSMNQVSGNPVISGGPSSVGSYVYYPNFTGDGTSGIYIWGAQIEMNSSAGAYYETTGSKISKQFTPKMLTAVAGEPRFDHDMKTSESKGLLMENTKTNDATTAVGPNSFDVTKMTIWYGAHGLDGSNTGYNVITKTGTATSSSYWGGGGDGMDGIPRTKSVFVKVLSGGTTFHGQGGAGDPFQWDVSTLSYQDLGGGRHPTGGVEDWGNGWYRLWVGPGDTGASPNVGGTFYFCPKTAGNYIFWGWQNEGGTRPTTYIPVGATAQTRSAEDADITGNNFTSFYTGDDFSAYWEGGVTDDAAYQGGMSFSKNTGERIIIGAKQASAGLSLNVRGFGNSTLAYLTTTTGWDDYGTRQRVAVRVARNDFAFSGNGIAALTDTSGELPHGINTFSLGASTNDFERLTGYITKVAFYPGKLTDDELQGLTEE